MISSKDYNLGDFEYPRGWFMIAELSEIKDQPISLRFFGKNLVLYRGRETNRLVLLDAHCVHMGAHLGRGRQTAIVKNDEQIDGDGIRCPYHGWRYSAEGVLDDVPYFDGPCPKGANLKSYTVVEKCGAAMMWHDPEGGEPNFDLPALEEWDRPEWIAGQYDHLGELNIHPQEILDNMADANHFAPTHGLDNEYFENCYLDQVYIQRQGGFRAEYNAYLTTYTFYTGPGLLVSRQRIGDIQAIELIFNTPVEQGVTKVWHNNVWKSENNPPTEKDYKKAKEFQAEILAAFSQDFDVWSSKEPALDILALAVEKNFSLGRTWHKQFYNPRMKEKEFHSKLPEQYSPQHKDPAGDIAAEYETTFKTHF